MFVLTTCVNYFYCYDSLSRQSTSTVQDAIAMWATTSLQSIRGRGSPTLSFTIDIRVNMLTLIIIYGFTLISRRSLSRIAIVTKLVVMEVDERLRWFEGKTNSSLQPKGEDLRRLLADEDNR